MGRFSQWTDDQLGQQWANIFVWLILAVIEDKPMIAGEQHERMATDLEALDAEMELRGLPVNPTYRQAFRERNPALIDEVDMTRIIKMTYGRDIRKDKPSIVDPAPRQKQWGEWSEWENHKAQNHDCPEQKRDFRGEVDVQMRNRWRTDIPTYIEDQREYRCPRCGATWTGGGTYD